jgi:hypothetical protein
MSMLSLTIGGLEGLERFQLRLRLDLRLFQVSSKLLLLPGGKVTKLVIIRQK